MGDVVSIKNAEKQAVAKQIIKQRMTAKATANATDVDDMEAERHRRAQKRIKKFRKANNDLLADVATLKYMREVAMDLMPIAVTQYKTWKNDRTMLALRNLIEQVKDTMVSLRSQEKGKKECEHIISQIVVPDMQLLLQQSLRETSSLKTQLNFLSPKDRKKVLALIDTASINTGQYYNGISAMISDKIADYLVGKK